MKDNELEYAVLTMVKMGCNLYSLRVANISNEDIIRILHKGLKNNVLGRVENGIALIDEQYWRRLGTQLGKRGVYRYMLPEYFYKQKKMNLEDVYIPLCIRKR